MWFDFFPFYSTLLIGNTKKAKELGQNISFWCHYYNSRGLYVQFCLLLFGKGFFYCQKSFSLEGFQKTEKAAPHHSVIKLPNFRCISKQKWHRKLKKGSQKTPCIAFFSSPPEASMLSLLHASLRFPTFVLYQMSSFENGSGNPRCCCWSQSL